MIDKGQLSIDDLFELGLGLSAVQEDPVDKETGRPADTGLGAGLPVRIHAGLELATRNTSAEGLLPEAERLGARDQIGILQLRGIGEERVVKLPKLSLLPGAPRRLRGRLGTWVDFPQRKIHIRQFYAAVIFGEETAQHGLGLLAVRTLVVGKLDDGHRGLGIAFDTSGVESNVDTGWPQQDCDLDVRAQGIGKGLARLHQLELL